MTATSVKRPFVIIIVVSSRRITPCVEASVARASHDGRRAPPCHGCFACQEAPSQEGLFADSTMSPSPSFMFFSNLCLTRTHPTPRPDTFLAAAWTRLSRQESRTICQGNLDSLAERPIITLTQYTPDAVCQQSPVEEAPSVVSEESFRSTAGVAGSNAASDLLDEAFEDEDDFLEAFCLEDKQNVHRLDEDMENIMTFFEQHA